MSAIDNALLATGGSSNVQERAAYWSQRAHEEAEWNKPLRDENKRLHKALDLALSTLGLYGYRDAPDPIAGFPARAALIDIEEILHV